MDRAESSSLANDCRKEIRDLDRRLLKLGRRDYDERRQIRTEIRKLNKERRGLEERAVEEVLKAAQV